MARQRKTATKPAKAKASKSKTRAKASKAKTSTGTRGRKSEMIGQKFKSAGKQAREGTLPAFVLGLLPTRGKKQATYEELVAGVTKGWKQPRSGNKVDEAFAKSAVNHVAKTGFIEAA